MKTSASKRVVVLGGAGAMGCITVHDLFMTAPQFHVVVADSDMARAQRLARRYKSKRVSAAAVDVHDKMALAAALDGCFAVIVALPYQFNVAAMQAALQAQCHYVDLGGLFHVTRQQLELNHAFRKINRLALLGMGAAPGITNLLARALCDTFTRVESIDIYVAGVDKTRMRRQGPVDTSYSIATILDEASEPAAVFARGKWQFVPAMSGSTPMRFPKPVGKSQPAYTLHSEVATLPTSFADKGVKNVSFRIAFDPALAERLRFLHTLGLTSKQPLDVHGQSIMPREVLLALLQRADKPEAVGPLEQYEILRAVVRGKRAGKVITQALDCHVPGIAEWGMGVDVDTGCPPSIAVQMLDAGEITACGALPPEQAIDPKRFFAALRHRQMRVKSGGVLPNENS